MRTRRLLGRLAAGAVAVLLVGVAGAAFLFYTSAGRESLRRLLVARLTDQVAGRVTIARLTGDLPNEVALHDVALVDSAGSLVFAAKRIGARVNVLQLFSKRIDVSRMELEHPTLVLRHQRGGAWNVARVFARDDRSVSDAGGRGFGHWVRITQARVTDGEVIVRMPWPADSEAVAVPREPTRAITDRARARIERTARGFEQVMQFQDIEAVFPRVLLAHPDSARIVAEVGRASMTAAPFQPPAADIRDLGGTLVVTSDSLHFVGWRVVLPDSRMTVQLQYAPTTGALRGRLRADPLAFRDLHWLYPLLPADGRGSVTIEAVRDTSGPLFLRAGDIVAQVGSARAVGELGFAAGDTVRLNTADVQVTGLDTELARQLAPAVSIPLGGTIDARARLERTDDALVTDAVLDFQDRRGARSHVTARGAITLEPTLGARGLRLSLAPLDANVVRALMPDARVAGRFSGQASVSGSVSGGWRVNGALAHIDRGALSRFIGTASVASRTTSVRFDGRLAPVSLAALARIAPELELTGSASGPVRAEITGDSVTFRTTLRVADGLVTGDGRVSWGDNDRSYDVTVETRGIDPGALSARLPRGHLSGTLTGRGRGTDPATMQTDVRAALHDVSLDTQSVDSLRLAARVADGVATIDSLVARRGTAHATAAGTLGLVANRSGDLRYAIRADSLGSLLGTDRSVAESNGDLGLPLSVPTARGVSGSASLEGTARGHVDSLRLSGIARFSRVAAGAGSAARAGAEYTVGLGRDDTVAVTLSADSAHLGQLAYEHAELRVSGTRVALRADATVRQTADVELIAKGVVSLDTTMTGAPARAGALGLHELALRLPTGDWRSQRPSSIAWRHGALVIDSLLLIKGDTAAVLLAGQLPASGSGTLQLHVSRLPLDDVATVSQSDFGVDAEVASSTRIGGNTAAPRATGSIALTRVVVGGDSLPDVRATLSYDAAHLGIVANVGNGGGTIARANVELPMNLALTGLSGPRFARHAPLLVEIRADSLPLTTLPRRNAIRLDSGWVRGQAQVRGSADAPEIAGRVEVIGGRAYVPATGVTVRNIVAAARLTNDSLVIDSVIARSNGPIRGAGTIVRSSPGARRVAATLSARDAEILGGSKGILHADADLVIAGTTDSLMVTGRAEVLHGFVERKGPGEQALHVTALGDPELFALIDTSALVRRASGPADVRPRRSVHTDVAVRLNPGVSYRSAPNARIEAFTPRDLRVRGDLLADDVTAGGVVLTRGGVYVFRLRPFEIVRGGATLAGASRVAPLIQAAGEHDVWIFGRGMLPVRFLASGFPSDVQFSLGDASVLPAAPPDVASFLSLGRPPVSLLQTESSSLSGLSTSGGRFTGELGALVRRQQVSPALGAVLYQLAKGARDAVGVGLFTVTPTDLPPELAESQFATIRGTTMDAGYLLGSRTYLGARIRLSAVAPGVVLVHSFRPDLELRAAYEPLFRLGAPPTLGPPQDGVLRRAFGAFLTREWWF